MTDTPTPVEGGVPLSDVLDRIFGEEAADPRRLARQQFTDELTALFGDLPEGETPTVERLLEKAQEAAAKWQYPKVVILLVNPDEEIPDHLPDVITLTNIGRGLTLKGALATASASRL